MLGISVVENENVPESSVEDLFEEAQSLKSDLKIAAAIEKYLDVLSLEPNHGWAHHCLAQSYHWEGVLDKSIEHYEFAAELLGRDSGSISLLQLSSVYLAQDKAYLAYSTLKAAEASNNPEVDIEAQLRKVQKILINQLGRFFEVSWYRAELQNLNLNISKIRTAQDAAEHYLNEGWLLPITSHWIFDSEYIISQLKWEYNDEQPLLLQFERSHRDGKFINPSYLFDSTYIRQHHANKTPLECLAEFVSGDCSHQIMFSYLFDPDFYSKFHLKNSDQALSARSNYSDDSPYYHYLYVGNKLNLSPHFLFHVEYYAKQCDEEHDDYLKHYLLEEGFKKYSPNPILDMEHYSDRYPEVDFDYVPILIHFLTSTDHEGAIANFDRKQYCDKDHNLVNANFSPEEHFLRYANTEPHRIPFSFFSSSYVKHQFPGPGVVAQSSAIRYYEEKRYKKNKVVLVSHNAHRTGAPLIALRLAECLAQNTEIELYTIVFGDGPLVNDFKKCSHVSVTENAYGADQEENRRILESINISSIDFIIANSAESRIFLECDSIAYVPKISLVHEMAEPYEYEDWEKIFELNQHVVFPSEAVRRVSQAKFIEFGKSNDYSYKTSVIPQGLLIENFGRYNKQKNRAAIKEELNLPSNAKVILGCGVVDFRKGTDLFIDAAIQTINSYPEDVYFLWLGKSIDYSKNDNYFYWKLKNIDNQITKKIIFIDGAKNVEPYFQAADLFLLSSRSDPFPCVMHEAMSSGLPIIYMKESGGAEEMVGDRCGIGVDFESSKQMSDAIVSLLSNDNQRREFGETGQNIIDTKYRYGTYVEKIKSVIIDSADASESLLKCLNSYDYDKISKTEKCVYFLSPDWGISGVNSVTENLVKELITIGVDAKILFTHGSEGSWKEQNTILPTVPYQFLVPTQADYPDNVWDSLSDYFQRHDPCIVVPNYDYTASSLSPILPDHVGIVGIIHSDDVEHYSHAYRLGHYWNHIICVSKIISKRVEEMNPAFANKLSAVANGVSKNEDTTIVATQRLNRTDPIRLVYAGRVVEHQKKISRYIDLALELDSRSIDYVLDIVGDGDMVEQIETQLKSQIKDGKVVIHGQMKHEEVMNVMNYSEVFLLLSDFEGMPMSLLEAYACQCVPIVYEMDSGISEVIDHGVNGYVSGKKSVSEVADFIESLTVPEQFNEVLTNCGTTLSEKELLASDMARSYKNIFDIVFEDITNGTYSRPDSLGFRSRRKGTLPPIWLS